jgi:DNA-directed RNA polymerase sigma subunit (sigma70/sigma32)
VLTVDVLVSTENLKNASKIASDAIAQLIKTLTYAWQNPLDKNAQDALVKETHDATPQAYKLVAASKSALPKITDPNNKQLLRQAADEAAEALQRLVTANKQVVVSVGQADVNDALDRFSSEEANLDSALLELDNGNFRTDTSKFIMVMNLD